MIKEWFIQIQENKEGPYSIEDLKQDPRITPDTLVWKKGFQHWKPIRTIPELKELFEEKPAEETEPPPAKPWTDSKGKTELALDLQRGLPPLIFWLLIVLLIAYLLFR